MIVLAVSVYAQDKDHIINRFDGQQPNSNINVIMFHDKRTTASGQNFGIIIQNLTQHKIKVYGRYFANLICGNAKNGNVEIEMKPGEKLGGEQYNFETNGLTETTFSEDCKAINNNRIKNVGFQITSVTDLTKWEQEKAAQPSSNKNSAAVLNDSGNKYGTSTSEKKSAIKNTAVYSNTQSTAAKSEMSTATSQTQVILNDLNRNLQNQEKVNNAIQGGLQELGNIFSEARNAKFEEKKAAIHGFYEKSKAMDEMILQTDTVATNAFYKKDYNIAVQKFYSVAVLQAESMYNNFSLGGWWISNKYGNKEKRPIADDYFIKSKDDDFGWTTLNLPNEIPDLFYIPTCHCYTDEKYQRKYDDAFMLLRKSSKCNAISHRGKTYEIKYDKKRTDNRDEQKAIAAIHEAVDSKQLTSMYDWIDYTNSFVWLGYLENKNARTVDDLYNGLAHMVAFFKNIQMGNKFISQSQSSAEQHYIEAAYNMIVYYISCYYYRINNELKNNPGISAQIAENLSKLNLFGGYYGLLASSKYVEQYSKKTTEKFSNPNFSLK